MVKMNYRATMDWNNYKAGDLVEDKDADAHLCKYNKFEDQSILERVNANIQTRKSEVKVEKNILDVDGDGDVDMDDVKKIASAAKKEVKKKAKGLFNKKR